MMDYFEQEIERLVRAVEERRSNGEPIGEIERELQRIKRQHGPRRISGTAQYTVPRPVPDK